VYAVSAAETERRGTAEAGRLLEPGAVNRERDG